MGLYVDRINIQSRVKGHHVYNYAFKTGEALNCSIEIKIGETLNEHSENIIKVFSSSKKMVGQIL